MNREPMRFFSDDYLMHYGVKGMKWKKRKGGLLPDDNNSVGDLNKPGTIIKVGSNKHIVNGPFGKKFLVTTGNSLSDSSIKIMNPKNKKSKFGALTKKKKMTKREQAKRFASQQINRVKGLRKKLPKMPKLSGEITVSHDVYYGGGKPRR